MINILVFFSISHKKAWYLIFILLFASLLFLSSTFRFLSQCLCHPNWACVTLQIGPVVGMTDFGTLMCGPCHYCPPSCCFSVGCDSSLGAVPPPLLEPLVQLADSDTVVLMTHCFVWGHPQSALFTWFSIISFYTRLCICTQWFTSFNS